MYRAIALATILVTAAPNLCPAASSPLLKNSTGYDFSKVSFGTTPADDLCSGPSDCDRRLGEKLGAHATAGLTQVVSQAFLSEILKAYRSDVESYSATLASSLSDVSSPLLDSLQAKLGLLVQSEFVLRRLESRAKKNQLSAEALASIPQLRATEQKLLAAEPLLLHRDVQAWIRKTLDSTPEEGEVNFEKKETLKAALEKTPLNWKPILRAQQETTLRFAERLAKASARVDMGCLGSQDSCLKDRPNMVFPLGDSEFFEILRHVLYLPQWSSGIGSGTREALCLLRSRLPARYGFLRYDPDPRSEGMIRNLFAGGEASQIDQRPVLLATDSRFRESSKESDGNYSNYLIKIRSDNSGRDKQWFARICSMVQNQIFQARKKAYEQVPGAQGGGMSAELTRLNNVTCVRDETTPAYKKLRESGAYKYEFSVEENKKSGLTFGFENLAPKDSTEVGHVTLPYALAGNFDKVEERLGKELENRSLLFVPRGQDAIKEAALKFLAPRVSSSVAYDSSGKWIEKKTGKALLFDDALKLFQKEHPQSRHWLRMLIETFGFLGAQTGVFYLESAYEWKVLNQPGFVKGAWDFGINEIGKKFSGLRGLGIDDNDFQSNARGHTIDGALYYAFARTNGFSIPESLLASTLASGLWEYFGELRQQASINDLTVTPTAGMAAAEAFINIGSYAGKGDPSRVLPKVFQYVFNVLEPFHDALDKNHTKKKGEYDKFGFPANLKHSFEAALKVGAERRGGSTHQVNQIKLDLEVVNIPNTDKPGSDRKIFYDGNISRIVASYGMDHEKSQEVKAAFSSVLVGFYQKKIELDRACQQKGHSTDDCRKGYSLATGLKTRFDYELRRGKGGEKDPDESIALCTILGHTLDITFYHKGLKIRAVGDVYGDYAMIRNFAVDKVPVDKYPNDIQSSIVSPDRYYHGLGVTANAEINMEYKNFVLKSSTAYDYIHSAFQSWDRYRDHGVHPTDSEQDQRLLFNLGVGYQFLGGLMETGAEYTHTDRRGETTLIQEGVKTPYRNEQTADIVTANLKVKF